MDPLDIVSSTAEAAFGTNEEGQIVIWNKAAEDLLGRPAGQVLGRPCSEILCGRDLFGNLFCVRDCNLSRMVRRRKAVRRFEIDVLRSSGEYIRVAFTIMCLPGPRPTRFTIIHLMEPVNRSREMEDLIHRILPGSGSPGPPSPGTPDAPGRPPALTAREIEVLRMVVAGSSTRRIAETLCISVATVRTHIEHILRKLGVHSKLEAVSLALRNQII